MTFFDWAIVAFAVVLAIRGWRRGFLREVIDWSLLLFGTIIVFRLSPAIGTIVSGMANVPYEVGRIVAGVVILVVLLVGSWLLGRVIAAALKVVPGVTTLNRMGGAVVGVAFAAVTVVLAVTVASAMPLPESTSRSVDSAIGESTVGSAITDPTGWIQPAVAAVSGEDVLSAVISVQEAVGDRLAAGTIPIPIPSVGDEPLLPSQSLAQQVFDAVNVHRITAGVDPLAWSPDLAVVAVERASSVYGSGVLALDADLTDDLRAAGIPGTYHTDLVVLAASVDGLVEAITESSAYAAKVEDPAVRKSGIGVIEGPYGLMAVQVVSG